MFIAHKFLIPCVAHFVLFIYCTEGLCHSLLLAVAQAQKFFITLCHVAPVFALCRLRKRGSDLNRLRTRIANFRFSISEYLKNFGALFCCFFRKKLNFRNLYNKWQVFEIKQTPSKLFFACDGQDKKQTPERCTTGGHLKVLKHAHMKANLQFQDLSNFFPGRYSPKNYPPAASQNHCTRLGL